MFEPDYESKVLSHHEETQTVQIATRYIRTVLTAALGVFALPEADLDMRSYKVACPPCMPRVWLRQ